MYLAVRTMNGAPGDDVGFEPCCTKCGARLGSTFASIYEAVKEWNKRAAVDEVDFVVAIVNGHRWIRADATKE